jgi:serine/threonine protein kinase
MNRYCKKCERITTDGNLWCQEIGCPAEEGYPVLSYGDYLGDLKVVKLLRVWRTSALYEAERGKEKVLLKVAHKGDDCEERLIREAVVLNSLHRRPSRLSAFFKSFLPRQRLNFLEILQPYPIPSKNAYGETTFRGEKKIYSVFRHVEGKFLSDVILENPQIWHYEAAWVIITLAETLRPLAASNKCHLYLTPEVILVETDSEGHYRPLLLDLGFMVGGDEIQSISDFWPRLCEPTYTAPELLPERDREKGRLLQARTVRPAADVFSLGAILFEMLAGKQVLDPGLHRDDKKWQWIANYRGSLPVDRPELESAGVIKIIDRALAPSERYNHVLELADALIAVYGRPPVEKQPTPARLYVLAGFLLILVIASLSVLLSIILH